MICNGKMRWGNIYIYEFIVLVSSVCVFATRFFCGEYGVRRGGVSG